MPDYTAARAALALDAQQTILPRSTAQQALAVALAELVPDETARLYVVCNRLLDPEENRYCEFDGILNFRDGRTSCPGCHRTILQTEGEEPHGWEPK